MRRGQSFARAFKRAVAVEYLQTGVKRQDIAMKYGLPSVQSVSNWVNCYLTPPEASSNDKLKTEVIYREHRFKNHQNAKERIGGFIQFYNEQRPHASIGMKGPSQVHKEQGKQKCLWARKESTKSVRSQLF